MKRWIAGVLVLGLLGTVLVAAPTAAEARPRGHFFGGLAVGALTGVIIGSVLAAPVYAAPPVVYEPAPVYAAPAPVYAAPPAPVCTSYWVNTYWNGYGWVPGHWEQACR